MRKLTDESYWAKFYTGKVLTPSSGRQSRFLNLLKENYSQYLLWRKIYARFLPTTPGLKFLEVGSAPGGNLIAFARRYNYDVYGVEYTENGCQVNRERFAAAGLSTDHVVCADFFAPSFQETYQSAFDLVMSRGFIEHFDRPDQVLAGHLKLLKAGGYLIIIIPHLEGLNYSLARFFNAEGLATHNLSIMNLDSFRGLFTDLPVEELYSGYYGTFSFGLFNSFKPGKKKLLHFLNRFQLLLNLLFHFLLGQRGWETRLASPYLIFIGRKK